MDPDGYVEPDGLVDMAGEITRERADVVVNGIYKEAMGAAFIQIRLPGLFLKLKAKR